MTALCYVNADDFRAHFTEADVQPCDICIQCGRREIPVGDLHCWDCAAKAAEFALHVDDPRR